MGKREKRKIAANAAREAEAKRLQLEQEQLRQAQINEEKDTGLFGLLGTFNQQEQIAIEASLKDKQENHNQSVQDTGANGIETDNQSSEKTFDIFGMISSLISAINFLPLLEEKMVQAKDFLATTFENVANAMKMPIIDTVFNYLKGLTTRSQSEVTPDSANDSVPAASVKASATPSQKDAKSTNSNRAKASAATDLLSRTFTI